MVGLDHMEVLPGTSIERVRLTSAPPAIAAGRPEPLGNHLILRWFPRWFARWFLEIGGWFPESVRWFAQMAGVVPLWLYEMQESPPPSC